MTTKRARNDRYNVSRPYDTRNILYVPDFKLWIQFDAADRRLSDVKGIYYNGFGVFVDFGRFVGLIYPGDMGDRRKPLWMQWGYSLSRLTWNPVNWKRYSEGHALHAPNLLTIPPLPKKTE